MQESLFSANGKTPAHSLRLMFTRSKLAKEQKADRRRRRRKGSRLVLIPLWVYLFFSRPAHVAKFRMRRVNGQKRLDWRSLISPITVKRRWGGGRRHAGSGDGLQGGGRPGRSLGLSSRQTSRSADSLEHFDNYQ